MEAWHRAAYAVSRVGALAGGGLLLLAAIIIGVDVLLRAVFSRSIGGADELSGYALAISTAWGLSFALLERAHIRIDSLYELAPAAMRATLDLLSLIGFFLFMSLTAQYAWSVLSQSVASNARSISALSTPLAVPQAIWFAGLIFLLLVVTLLFMESAFALARGDLHTVARLIGSKAVTEEIDQEKTVRERAPSEPRS